VLFERGFIAVDATVRGGYYRFVNTHLETREPVPREFQCAQAAELIATLESITPPERSIIVVGDMNSSPEDIPIPISLPLPGLPPSDHAGVVAELRYFNSYDAAEIN
jgi:endonuclease/exonuclease/phosphatase family metal-dependent hydrolase